MNLPSPAIVAQGAVRRLPRVALWLLVLGYALPGFFGRDPWKSADVAAFGYMAEIAAGHADLWQPELLGLAPDFPALLPYWMGAGAIALLSPWVEPDLAVRLPFLALLLLALSCTWHAIFQLARTPGAQPVAFAFGGEASPNDYARALADAGLLALLACLGLAQFSHETTPALAQLAFTACILHGFALQASHAGPPATMHPDLHTEVHTKLHTKLHTGLHTKVRAQVMPLPSLAALGLGLAGLTLSGAPHLATLFGGIGAALMALRQRMTDASVPHHGIRSDPIEQPTRLGPPLVTALLAASSYGAAASLGLLHWNLAWPGSGAQPWDGIGRTLIWFTWPAGPLALWSLWRWRGHWRRPHLALPLCVAAVSLVSAAFTAAIERSLLLSLPALAALAAFALPTLRRSLAALIDWFTLLFFSGCAIIIWVVWLAMQTGFPAKPAANVARLAPGFEPTFSWALLIPALAATLLWGWLVSWRVGRHRAAIWKSLVLPAGGATLCWLLLMTLWLPLLDHARSHRTLIDQLALLTQRQGCIEVQGLARGQIAALRHDGHYIIEPHRPEGRCPWLLLGTGTPADREFAFARDPAVWQPVSQMSTRVESREAVRLLRRVGADR